MITAVSILVGLAVAAALTFGRFARSTAWRATVTPLASIIGSGFLICGPLLAKEFGSAAILAMAALLAISYAVGAVIRFNIVHVERIAPQLSLHDPMAWAMRAAQVMLAIAYAVSVAYYLKLLAEFTLKPLAVSDASHGLIANVVVTVIILALTALTFSGDIRKIEHAAHASVSVKLGIIAGLLAGLGAWWATRSGGPLVTAGAAISLGHTSAARAAYHRARLRDVPLPRRQLRSGHPSKNDALCSVAIVGDLPGFLGFAHPVHE